MKKTIITCAITGAETTRDMNPNLPLTADEIAAAAYDAYLAGASILHLHARTPEGPSTQDSEVFKEIIDKIRKKCDIVIEITTGGAVGMSAEERIAPVKLGPDMASLDCGTVNFGDDYIINTLPMMREFASIMNEYKVKPTLEVFETSHIYTSLKLIKEGLVKPPFHYGLVLNVPCALPFNVQTFAQMLGILPEESLYTFIGIGGKASLDGIHAAAAFGGHIRAGFEDNIYMEKGVLAKSNAELVERAARILKSSGKEIATPADVRQHLGLKGE